MSESKTKARRLRELLRDARPVVSPGIYDGYSARLVQKMGFKTAATTGAGLTNSLIVQPDIGTALVYAAALIAVLFTAGVRWTHLAAMATVALGQTRAVGMPRALSCAAIPLYECTPAARISAITGDSARARVSAWATIACLAAARASCVNLPLIGTANRVVDTMMMMV